MNNSGFIATTHDLEDVPGVSAATIRRLDNGDMVFTRARAAGLIAACTAAQIAVLGFEIFPGLNVSTYDQFLKDDPRPAGWPEYVRVNNVLAEHFLKDNPAPSDAECILTTASWREFCKIQEFRNDST